MECLSCFIVFMRFLHVGQDLGAPVSEVVEEDDEVVVEVVVGVDSLEP